MKFFLARGSVRLGARSWVRIGLGVRLGSVFSLSSMAKLLPYELPAVDAYGPVWITFAVAKIHVRFCTLFEQKKFCLRLKY